MELLKPRFSTAARLARGVRSQPFGWSALLFAALSSACVPDFDDSLSQVTEARILALQAEPAQAEEGEPVVLRPFVASSDGSVVSNDIAFAFCLRRKPLSELGPVDPACLLGDDDALDGLGRGSEVEATVPEDACSLFGPRRPDPEPGKPAGRPVDPDLTGGYHQPVLAQLPGEFAVLGAVRLNCGLPGVTREQAAEYTSRYRPNTNLDVVTLELRRAGQWQTVPSAEDEAVQLSVKRGAELRLRVTWPKCTADEACNGAEDYLRYDSESRSLVEEREEVTASWFASDGTFVNDRSSGNNSSSAENRFVAPSNSGVLHLWVVLRDGRGGTGFGSFALDVN